ncbi:profilin [Parachaetomium inaequale]|uniref:Profilin n=1 Tax=Parachaetomium inaequale TaxID=2588326 RepID=A0AAN6SV90_9PEZI|nr:profilin [Parachaetomium inaequale]
MSWQAYVDTSLVGSGHIDKACIVSAAGDSIWAGTTGFNPKPEELKVIAAILNEGAKDHSQIKDTVFADGLFVGGERFVVTRVADRSGYARAGKEGIVLVLTKQAILIGHHGENTIAGNASATVESLADYLIGQGY